MTTHETSSSFIDKTTKKVGSSPHLVTLGATEGAAALLDEGSLILQDGQSLLEPGNFCLAASLPVLVGLRLGNALVLNLLEVLVDCSELGLNVLLVGGQFGVGLLQASCLLGLVLDVLLLSGLLDLVFLGLLFVGVLCGLLRRVHL